MSTTWELHRVTSMTLSGVVRRANLDGFPLDTDRIGDGTDRPLVRIGMVTHRRVFVTLGSMVVTSLPRGDAIFDATAYQEPSLVKTTRNPRWNPAGLKAMRPSVSSAFEGIVAAWRRAHDHDHR